MRRREWDDDGQPFREGSRNPLHFLNTVPSRDRQRSGHSWSSNPYSRSRRPFLQVIREFVRDHPFFSATLGIGLVTGGCALSGAKTGWGPHQGATPATIASDTRLLPGIAVANLELQQFEGGVSAELTVASSKQETKCKTKSDGTMSCTTSTSPIWVRIDHVVLGDGHDLLSTTQPHSNYAYTSASRTRPIPCPPKGTKLIASATFNVLTPPGLAWGDVTIHAEGESDGICEGGKGLRWTPYNGNEWDVPTVKQSSGAPIEPRPPAGGPSPAPNAPLGRRASSNESLDLV